MLLKRKINKLARDSFPTNSQTWVGAEQDGHVRDGTERSFLYLNGAAARSVKKSQSNIYGTSPLSLQRVGLNLPLPIQYATALKSLVTHRCLVSQLRKRTEGIETILETQLPARLCIVI